MRRGGRILVVLGLLLGAITAVGTFLVLSSAVEQGRQIPTKQVVVALQPITDRSIIGPDAVGIKEWPETALPPGEIFSETSKVVGMLAIQPIFPGQIILPPMIIDKKKAGEIGTRSNAAFVIPEGKVAIAFGISEITGVGNALQPGDYVDLLLTLDSASLPTCPPAKPCTGLEGLPVTQMMLQDVLILQVGAWSSGGEGSQAAAQAGILTFAVDRQDALALKSAREQGQIDLVLRRAGDHKTVDLEPVTLQYLNKRFKFNLTPPLTSQGR
ncbi:MAG: Flp pilus assembly protein CpaB [Chloroflexi bacterium]|nr:Flp pilus assembly protein CpaB [Chloroflexota bacterium]